MVMKTLKDRSRTVRQTSAINVYSVQILQKGLQLVSAVQHFSVNDITPHPRFLGGDKYPQMILVLGRL